MDDSELFIQLNKIESELYKIYDIVTSEKEISVYKSSLLATKLDILKNYLEIILISLIDEDEKSLEHFEKYQKFTFLILLIAVILLFVNVLFSMGMALLFGVFRIKNNKQFNKIIESNEVTLSVINKFNKMDITFANCYTFLNARTNPEIDCKDDELTDVELKNINLANQTIEINVESNLDNIPEDIKTKMISGLQDNLETDETDLDKLLSMFYDQSIDEDENEMIRKRDKK